MMANNSKAGTKMLRDLQDDGLNHYIFKRPSLVFNNIVNGLKYRSLYVATQNRTLFLSPDILNRHAIPKAYFHYWMGDAMLCTRFDRSSCESIVASGLFDSALMKGRIAAAYKGIVDYDSAIRYCKMMLEDGGGCEQSLPVSFKENNLNRNKMCGTVSLSGGGQTMTNPHDRTEVLPVLHPLFSNLEQERSAS